MIHVVLSALLLMQNIPVFAVVMTRHGVRSFTKPPAAYTWLDWSPVAPGFLTAHGYTLITYLGRFYAHHFGSVGLPIDCTAQNMYVYADVDQRTLETGRALIEGACGTPDALPLYHDAAIGPGVSDPLFDGSDWLIPAGKVDTAASIASVAAVAPQPPSAIVTQYAGAFTALQSLLDLQCNGTCPRADAGPSTIGASKPGGLAALRGPLDTGESYVESMFLEQAQCATALDATKFDQALQLRTAEYTINARNEYNAAVKGANMFAHIVGMMLAKAGMPHPDVSVPAITHDNVVMLSGHDTQLGALGGILGGPVNDAPPGGALVFVLERSSSGDYRVYVSFVHEKMAQLRSASELRDGIGATSVGQFSLTDLAARAHAFAQRGLVQYDWTPQSDAPVDLAPLADPAWTKCSP